MFSFVLKEDKKSVFISSSLGMYISEIANRKKQGISYKITHQGGLFKEVREA